MPQRKGFGYGLLLYAFSVSLATVYGRYHYAADVLAGFGVSLLPGLLFWIARKR
jgi:membrane-associated phospholipid phosphatase